MSDRPIKSRMDYAFHHFNSAKYFCARLAEIESTVATVDINFTIMHQAYASSVVLSAVAFLEASINAFMPDADTNKIPVDSVDSAAGRALASMWQFVEKKPVLDKFQIALLVARRQMFDPGSPPCQDVALLVNLRNALVHFKPEWDDELRDHLRIEKQLRGKFPLNPFATDLEPFFPKRCLGLGCANWAVHTSEQFMTEFYRRMGTEFLLEYLRPR
jgi:hypothetical protein